MEKKVIHNFMLIKKYLKAFTELLGAASAFENSKNIKYDKRERERERKKVH